MRKILVLAFLATGLAFTSVAAAAPVPQAGQLIMSMACPKEWWSLKYSVLVRKVGGGKKAEVVLTTAHFLRGIVTDFDRDQVIGNVIITSLPAGDYEVYGVGGMFSDGVNTTNWRSKPDFSLPVKITAGRAAYVGQFEGKPPLGGGIFAATRLSAWPYVLSDQSARDLPIAKTAHHVEAPIDIQVSDPKTADNPFLSAP
jgi:hypothetical protein